MQAEEQATDISPATVAMMAILPCGTTFRFADPALLTQAV